MRTVFLLSLTISVVCGCGHPLRRGAQEVDRTLQATASPLTVTEVSGRYTLCAKAEPGRPVGIVDLFPDGRFHLLAPMTDKRAEWVLRGDRIMLLEQKGSKATEEPWMFVERRNQTLFLVPQKGATDPVVERVSEAGPDIRPHEAD